MVAQRKPAIKKTVGGKVFALDYGRLMGDPIYGPIYPVHLSGRLMGGPFNWLFNFHIGKKRSPKPSN